MKVSDKNPETMAATAINAEIEKLVKADSELTHAFIAAGRGHERPSEYLTKTDDLSRRARLLFDRRHQLRMEVERRAGPGMTRLPRGFGPLKKNPAKLERCVKEVKAKGGARNAYAVCKASLAGTTKRRRKNPPKYWYIHIQRGAFKAQRHGPVMLFNGRSFASPENGPPQPFSSAADATSKAKFLLRRHPKLRDYAVWVSDQIYGAPKVERRVNPDVRGAALDEAARKLEDFTGHAATKVRRAAPRSEDKTGLIIGELDLIGYRAARKGVEGGRMTRYAHTFKKHSRPLLAVSSDGKQLHVVGGQYEFTDAGIEDR